MAVWLMLFISMHFASLHFYWMKKKKKQNGKTVRKIKFLPQFIANKRDKGSYKSVMDESASEPDLSLK